jgi:hypothetical protein
MESTFTVPRFETWARARNLYLISYAASMLIAASYVLLAPESLQAHAQATAQRARRTAHYDAGVNADERALGQSLP